MRHYRTIKVEGELFEPGGDADLSGVILAVFFDLAGEKWFAFETAHEGVHVVAESSRFLLEISP